MEYSSVRPTDGMETVIRTYGNMLFRLCLVMLGNESDTEDVIQETMIKYLQKAPVFESPEHEKAWLITVATNKCRDMLRFRLRYSTVDIESFQMVSSEAVDSGIFDALMTLPEKFRLVLLLYYVEEYRIEDIARITGKTPSAVKMRLQKGRKLLKEKYRKEYL